MMTNPCTLPRSRNSLFKLSKQHFADQPVKSTPVIINAANDHLHTLLQENSGVFGSSTADLSSTLLVQHYNDTGNAKPIKQRAYRASHHHRQEIEKQVEEMLCNGIIEPSVSPWASPVVLVTKADNTLRLCIDIGTLIKRP